MKWTLIIAIAVVLTLGACDKTVVCSCAVTTTNLTTGEIRQADTSYSYHSRKKKDADSKCDSYDNMKTYSENGDSVTKQTDCSFAAWGTGIL